MTCHHVQSFAEFQELVRALNKLCSPGAKPGIHDYLRARQKEPGLTVLVFVRRERQRP